MPFGFSGTEAYSQFAGWLNRVRRRGVHLSRAPRAGLPYHRWNIPSHQLLSLSESAARRAFAQLEGQHDRNRYTG